MKKKLKALLSTTNTKTLSASIVVLMYALPATAQDNTANWDFGFELYGWLPDVEMTTIDGTEIDLTLSDILDNLDFTLQGTAYAERGNWTIFADGVYLGLGLTDNVSSSEPVGRFGRVDTKVKAEIDQNAFISTFGAGYKFYENQNTKLSAVGGLRYLYMDLEVDAKLEGNAQVELLGREFSRQFENQLETDGSGSNQDVIVGVQGETKINDDWKLLYYADVGTGDSDYTWQASLGVSYAFENFEITLRYRYLDFQLDNNDVLDELTVYGPQVGIVFEF